LALAAGSSLIFSCHEPEVVLRQSEQVVCLQQGAISFSGGVHDLYSSPATAELGRFLGPLNWWSPDDVSALQESSVTLPANTCIRPHQVWLLPNPQSALQVVSSQHCGLYQETLLQPRGGSPIAVFHQHSETLLSPGTSVTISIRSAA
jgi:ABC-type Fe3+/spermidine/putrescine transport system ATPase subunit